MTRTILSLLFIFLISTIKGQNIKSTDIQDIALDYMQAYSDWNYKRMSSFYHDSIHFHDPTAELAFNGRYEFFGVDSVKNFIKNAFGGAIPEFLVFKVNENFVSNDFVIINSTFESILPKAWFGDKTKGKVFVSLPFVTILKFKANKIISHTDYADYKTYKYQISLQMEK